MVEHLDPVRLRAEVTPPSPPSQLHHQLDQIDLTREHCLLPDLREVGLVTVFPGVMPDSTARAAVATVLGTAKVSDLQ